MQWKPKKTKLIDTTGGSSILYYFVNDIEKMAILTYTGEVSFKY